MSTAKDTIDQILEARRKPAEPEPASDKFFLALAGEGMQESFLELQFQTGLRTCFAYTDLSWFNFDPESNCLDMEFGGFLVTIKGRALYPGLFQGIKGKRVVWIKESDSELQDHEGNDVFVESIFIKPPKGFGGEDEAEEE